MPKKLALFILGIMLAVGAFYLYQYVSGSRPGVVQKFKPATTGTIEQLDTSFEENDTQGNPVYRIRADKSPEPILDQVTKEPIPGQYKITKPEATFYKAAGRVVRVTADTCTVVLDQAPKAGALPTGGGGKLKEQISLRTGELQGHVKLYISGQTGSGAKDPFPGGARIYFDGPVKYDRAQDQLTTPDGVHIRSETASFDGTGLKFAINQQAERIDFLRIEKGKEILMHGMGDKLPSFTETVASPVASAPAPVASAPASRAASTKPEKLPVAYRLNFTQDVLAATGARSLAADRLNILFMAAQDMSGNAKTAPAATVGAGGVGGAAATAAGPSDPAAIPDMPDEPEPIAAAKGNDLHIAWSGPMELRPAAENDVKLADPKDILLEALGSAQRPVVVKDAERTVQAGRLWYHGSEGRVEFEPGSFAHVILADAVKGTIDCPSVSILLQKSAVFKGPGTLVARAASGDAKGTTTVNWKTRMDVELSWSADPKDPKKQVVAVRRAVMDGAVIKSSVFDLAADSLDALIANVTVDKKSVQALEHLVAKGHVAVMSYRRDGSGEQGGLKASDEMEIFTAPGAGGPVPSQLVASGNVSAWRFKEKDKNAATLPAAPAGPVAAIVGNRGLEKDSITTAKLVAELKQRPKTETKPSDTAIAGMGDFDVTHFLAQDDVRVDITPGEASKQQPILALANKLDAYPMEGKATLMAAEGKTIPVRVSMGENSMEARTIQMDQHLLDKQDATFAVPGDGVFNFILPADGKTRKQPTPMQVTWDKSMSYDDKKHLAVFMGNPVARMPGEQSDLGWLRSDESLTVQLKEIPRAPATRGAVTRAAATATAAANPLGQDLTLDWMEAVGNVHASGAELGAGNKKTRDFQFSALDEPGKPGRLHFTNDSQVFEIPGPGALVVMVDQPKKAPQPPSATASTKPGETADETANANGQSVFGWKESLKFDGSSGVVTFKKDVDFIFTPRDGFNFSRSGGVGIPGGGPRPSTTPATAKTPDRAHLKTDLLVANFVKLPGKSVPSPIGIGSGGNLDLTSVTTSSGAFLDVGGYNIGGDALTMDMHKHTVLILPAAGERVIVEQPASGQRVTGTRVLLDMTKDKKFFEIRDMQGNISGFGG